MAALSRRKQAEMASRQLRAATEQYNAALALQAGLLGSAVAIFFVSGQYQKLLWLTVFLSVCMPGIVQQSHTLKSNMRFQP